MISYRGVSAHLPAMPNNTERQIRLTLDDDSFTHV